MKAEALLEKLDSLLIRDGDGDGNGNGIHEGRNSASPPPRQIIAYEYERFLAAWVLLTRFPQEQLDRAWEKHGNELSYFATCLLTNIDNDVDIVVDNHALSKNGGDNGGDNLLYTFYIRLVAQVTARLTIPPSKDLRRTLYTSWKRMSTVIVLRDVAVLLSAPKFPNSTIIALNADVYNAFIAWMDHDVAFFSSDVVMKDIWNAHIAAHITINQSAPVLEEENNEKQNESTSIGAQSKFQNNDRIVMLNVLESLLGRPSNAENIYADEVDADDDGGDIYTSGNVQKLIFVIFELHGTKCASEELLSSILLWNSRDTKGEMFNLDLRILWDGWLMKNIGDCISEKNNDTTLLRDPEKMDAIQKLTLAHAVSPNILALRPIAWQTISQIIKTYGWNWIQKSSIKTSICTWCRLACGEWKIQLEEDGNLLTERPNRLTILDGCGRMIISIVQYLVDFDERPDKKIPFGTESLLSIREALEETLSLTSAYLSTSPCANDDIESAIIINLWSELFSEIDLSTSEEAKNRIACLKKLLLVSNDESLVQAVLNVISAHHTDENFLNEVEDFENAVIEASMVFIEKFWKNIAKQDSLTKWYAHDIVRSACFATEILADILPDRIQPVANAIFDAVEFLVESLAIAPTKQRIVLTQSLRLVIDPCAKLLDEVFRDTLPTSDKSYIISSAIKILEEK